MVSTASFVFIIFTLLVTFGLPIGLAIYLCVKQKASFLAVLVGALVFFVSQLLIRIPLLQWLAGMPWYQAMSANLLLFTLFLSFTAGLFEESGRYLGFRFLLKNRLETKNALAYGVGHGGFEAIALVGLTYINNLVISLMINSGAFDQNLAPTLGASAAAIKAQLIDIPPLSFAAGGVERALTIICHIAMSLLVYYAVRYGKLRFYFFSILAHTLLNLGAVLIAQAASSVWFSELYLLAVTVLALLLIFRSSRLEAHLTGPAASAEPAEVLPGG